MDYKCNVKLFVADKFCFSCIKQWIKVVSSKLSKQLSSVKCPLCKVCFLETLFSSQNILKNLLTGMTITICRQIISTSSTTTTGVHLSGIISTGILQMGRLIDGIIE